MELTNEVIELGYKHAWILLKKMGRRDVSYEDLAHDAFLKLTRIQEPPPEFFESKIRWITLSTWRDFYTNKTTRKHNVMLNAALLPFDLKTHDPDTVAAKDQFVLVFKRLYDQQPTQFEILMNRISGRTLQELAMQRGTSTQAVHELQMKARKEIIRILSQVA